MELSDNYYEVLGVPRHADGEQIKRAYRKLALKWHPDKNLDKRDLAKANFRRLAEAYEVLSDSRKRQIYDQCGKDGLTNGAGDETSGARFGFQEDFFGGDGAGAFNQFSGMTGFSFRDPNDVFKDFFGNSDPFGGLFSDISEGAAGGNERRTSGANMFPGPFVMSSQMGGDFGGMSSLGMQMSSGDCGGMSSLGMQMSSGDCSGMSSLGIQMSSGDCGGAGVKRISTSVNTANGIRIETKKIVENGIETVIVSENGQVKSKTVGDHPTNQ